MSGSAAARLASLAVASLGLASLVLASLTSQAVAATSGDNGSHDPSRMLESNGKVYIYSTGGGAKSSPDGLAWTDEPGLPWNLSLLPNNQRLWAPDGIYLNNQYYLYGSMWSDAKASAIILLTSPTLDPSAADYEWTDRGVVVAGPSGVSHSVIDAAPVVDTDGNLWMVWGGGYPFPDEADSIFLTRLDNQTGLPLASDPGYNPPDSPGYALKKGHKEGPYIHYHDGYYYLFWQTGNCCGLTNAYVMHVDRSANITGPYSGDRVFYSSTGNIYGPGHMGIYDACGFERFTYHYYPPNGNSVIGVNELLWGDDGWPVVGPESTTPLVPCGVNGEGGASGGNAGAGSGGTGGSAGNGGSSSGAAGNSAAGNGGVNGSSGNAGSSSNGGSSNGGVSGNGASDPVSEAGGSGNSAGTGGTQSGGAGNTMGAAGGTPVSVPTSSATTSPGQVDGTVPNPLPSVSTSPATTAAPAASPSTSPSSGVAADTDPNSDADCACRTLGSGQANRGQGLGMLALVLALSAFRRPGSRA